MRDRTALAPARHWPDQPALVGGRDLSGGGTWMALNDAGSVAVLLNRRGTLGPAAGYRSRGLLPLIALERPTAEGAREAILDTDLSAWRPFNLLLADARGGWWIEHEGEGRTRVTSLRKGRWVLHSGPANDPHSERTAAALPALLLARHPCPREPDSWSDLLRILAAPAPKEKSPFDGVFVRTPVGFGTVSTSLVAVPTDVTKTAPRWAYAAQRVTTFDRSFREVLPSP